MLRCVRLDILAGESSRPSLAHAENALAGAVGVSHDAPTGDMDQIG